MTPQDNPRPALRSQRLNQITHEPHSKLDALVKAHAPFETQANFARFVVAQYLFQSELVALYNDAELNRIVPDLAERCRAEAAKADLADLDTEVPAPVVVDSSPTVPLSGKGGVDFGGHAVTDTRSLLAMGITPKSSPFALIASANAAAPLSSCVADLPRIEGQVKSLADDKPLQEFATNEFFPGLNGKPWATAVNGHSVAVGPVAVLRDGAKVAQAPKLQFITDYASAQKKQSPGYASVANTYEGESQILYRVFALDQQKSPVSCIDIVFDKRAGNAVAGEIYYPKQGDAYVAQFTPKRR